MNNNSGSISPLTATLKSVDLDSSQIQNSIVIDPQSGFNSCSSSESNTIDSLTTQLTSSVIEGLDLSITASNGIKEINELHNRYKIFEKCFECLTNIDENEKIWIDNDMMVIDNSPYYNIFLVQSINRYINNQGRDNLFSFLDVKFTEYMRYLDNIKDKMVYNTDNKLLKKIIQDNIHLINLLIPGLDTLKTTYHDDDKLSNKITSIILTFIDFKDMIEKEYNIM